MCTSISLESLHQGNSIDTEMTQLVVGKYAFFLTAVAITISINQYTSN